MSERISRVLRRGKYLNVGYQIGRYPIPKEWEDADRTIRSVVYKIECQECDFVHIGQTELALRTRIKTPKIVCNLPTPTFIGFRQSEQ